MQAAVFSAPEPLSRLCLGGHCSRQHGVQTGLCGKWCVPSVLTPAASFLPTAEPQKTTPPPTSPPPPTTPAPTGEKVPHGWGLHPQCLLHRGVGSPTQPSPTPTPFQLRPGCGWQLGPGACSVRALSSSTVATWAVSSATQPQMTRMTCSGAWAPSSAGAWAVAPS